MKFTIQTLSKLGRKPIKFQAAKLTKTNQTISIKGPQGQIQMNLHPSVALDIKPTQVSVHGTDKAMWGTTRALLARNIQGVEDGYTLPLRIVGVGYRALIEDEKLSLKIGVSHPVLLDIPAGITVTIP